MTILYLYTELMGYNIPVIKELTKRYKAKVHLVHWDKGKLTPYIPPIIKDVVYYNRSEFNENDFIALAKQIKPNIVYVPNWYDKGYLKVCYYLKQKNIPIVAGLDNQWKGSLKQWFGCFIMRVYLKKFFSHIWVSGPYQYEFARRLGFKKTNILFNFYSADVEGFFNIERLNKVPHKFLFVGRLEKVKGIDVLLNAWNTIENKKDWSLTLIGSGTLKADILKYQNVELKDFMQPELLLKEINNYGCFVLPSIYEPWGVVIHEFVAAGMPMIVTNTCGAAPIFVIPNYNGFLVNPGNVTDLRNKMEKIISLSDEELLRLRNNSIKRGNIITPEISAASFMSAFN